MKKFLFSRKYFVKETIIIYKEKIIIMVLASKIFYLKEHIGINTIAAKLKDYRLTEIQQIDDKEYEIGKSVTSLEATDNGLKGVFEESFIVDFKYRDEEFKIPLSITTYFEFYRKNGNLFLILLAKKERANRIATLFSTVLTAEKNQILEIEIPSETLQKLVETRREQTKVIFFDNVKLPGVEKLSLYGSNILDTNLYQEYIKIGKIWYIVLEMEENIVVGLTRNGIVTFFSKILEEEALDFIKEKIIPLSRFI